MSVKAFSLRNVLLIDAVTCALTGALLIFGARILAQLTAIPSALLFCAGAILIPVAAFMALTAIRSTLSPFGVWVIIAGNALWVVASVGLMIGPWIAPNVLGYAFVAGQAVVVAVLTKFEHDGVASAAIAA
jgi:hypothetical protein